ncbi:hypothetical protein [Rhodococcus erythropolis]|uniref:hypothetical protein n=1 Tax=Rhodococcus erythropolis TaxID=1833 RepID=UPI0004C325D1|nr:hypothetical protein [Rhodococcus erythropolis]BBE43399.1 hypothetical protein RE2895_03300 [Rhodococcus erythropolis]
MSENIGNQLPQPDPRGLLTFDRLPRGLRIAEDATQAGDHETSKTMSGGSPWTRPATPAERTLLTHLGYELPDELDTTVRYVTSGVRERTWPTLDN